MGRRFCYTKGGKIKYVEIYSADSPSLNDGLSNYVKKIPAALKQNVLHYGKHADKSYIDAMNNRPTQNVNTVAASIGYHGDHDAGDYSVCLCCTQIPKYGLGFNVKFQGKITMEWYGGGTGCYISVIGTDREYKAGDRVNYGHVYDFDSSVMGEAYATNVELFDSVHPDQKLAAYREINKLTRLNTAVIPKTGKTDVILDVDIPIYPNTGMAENQYVAVFLLGGGWGSCGGDSDYGGGGNFDCTVHATTLKVNTYVGSQLGIVSDLTFKKTGQQERYFMSCSSAMDEYVITGTLLTTKTWHAVDVGETNLPGGWSGRDCDCQGEGYELETCYELELVFSGAIKYPPIKYISKTGATVIIDPNKLKRDAAKGTYTHNFGTMWSLDEIQSVYPRTGVTGYSTIKSCDITERTEEPASDCGNCNGESNCQGMGDDCLYDGYDCDCFDCDQDCGQC